MNQGLAPAQAVVQKQAQLKMALAACWSDLQGLPEMALGLAKLVLQKITESQIVLGAVGELGLLGVGLQQGLKENFCGPKLVGLGQLQAPLQLQFGQVF